MKKTVKKRRETRKVCKSCGERAVVSRMFDIDGTNIVEHEVCLSCGAGTPAIY